MALCKLPGERMNWVCDGTNLWALQDEKGLVMTDGKALVIRRDLIEPLCKRNTSVAYFVRKFGLREFIEGPHMHLVYDDGMRGLKL